MCAVFEGAKPCTKMERKREREREGESKIVYHSSVHIATLCRFEGRATSSHFGSSSKKLLLSADI